MNPVFPFQLLLKCSIIFKRLSKTTIFETANLLGEKLRGFRCWKKFENLKISPRHRGDFDNDSKFLGRLIVSKICGARGHRNKMRRNGLSIRPYRNSTRPSRAKFPRYVT